VGSPSSGRGARRPVASSVVSWPRRVRRFRWRGLAWPERLARTGVVALALVGATASHAVAGGSAYLNLVLPPVEGHLVPSTTSTGGDPIRIDLERTGNTVVARMPLATLDMGEMSPLSPDGMIRSEVTLAITSPFGLFPRYEVTARSLTPAGGPAGSFTTADIGFGITEIVARNPRVNPPYDYDPSTVSKNVDGEPRFLGTIESLGTDPARTLLYRTRGFYFGSTNTVTLVLAVGPQFYTPTGAPLVEIELALTIL